MQLLDIIIDGPSPYISRPAATYATPPQDTSHVVSSVDVSGNMQQMENVMPDSSGIEEMLGTNMMLALIVVALALCLCSYFVFKYRRSHSDVT